MSRTRFRPAKALPTVPVEHTMRFIARLLNDSSLRIPKRPCIPWPGPPDNKGYGQFRVGARVLQAHRVAYAIFNGPIAEGMTIDHNYRGKPCTTKRCCNPHHLRQLTLEENTALGNITRHGHRVPPPTPAPPLRRPSPFAHIDTHEYE
jgi:hypothetical protein